MTSSAAAVEGGDSFSAHACVPVSGLRRDLWHVQACRVAQFCAAAAAAARVEWG